MTAGTQTLQDIKNAVSTASLQLTVTEGKIALNAMQKEESLALLATVMDKFDASSDLLLPGKYTII